MRHGGHSLALSLVLVLGLSACTESTEPVDDSGPGHVRANLSGALAIDFEATGSYASTGGSAFGLRETDGGVETILVQGTELVDEGAGGRVRGRSVNLWFWEPRVGRYGVGDLCSGLEVPEDETPCGVVMIYADGIQSILETGSITITALRERRIIGTFEGQGRSWRDGGMKLDEVVHIEGGSFDVEIFGPDDDFSRATPLSVDIGLD